MRCSYAGALRNLERTLKETQHVGDNVEIGINAIAIMHHDDSGVRFGDSVRHVGIALQPPHIIHNRNAHSERAPRRQPSVSRSAPQ